MVEVHATPAPRGVTLYREWLAYRVLHARFDRWFDAWRGETRRVDWPLTKELGEDGAGIRGWIHQKFNPLECSRFREGLKREKNKSAKRGLWNSRDDASSRQAPLGLELSSRERGKRNGFSFQKIRSASNLFLTTLVRQDFFSTERNRGEYRSRC